MENHPCYPFLSGALLPVVDLSCDTESLLLFPIPDVFLPCPDSLLVNFSECRDLIVDLLNMLPNLFEGNMETGSALGAALQAGFKMTVSNNTSCIHFY